MNKSSLVIIIFSIILLFSCRDQESSSNEVEKDLVSESETNKKVNLIVFFIPGLNQEVFSILLKDPNSRNLKNFNQIGAYEPISYFDDYSDLNSNLSALMTGKTTLIGHLGIDKDSIVQKSWIADFKESGYQTSIITDGSLGSSINGSIFTGKIRDISSGENTVLNMIRHKPDFIWGMGTNLFTRRNDGKNLFEELGINEYNLSLDINNIQIKAQTKFAGIYNNYSIPDSIDLTLTGLKNWVKIKNAEPHLLIVSYLGLEDLLKKGSKSELYKINSYIDFVMDTEGWSTDSYLFLLINPFQNYDRQFELTKGDTLKFTSKPLRFNQFHNSIWAFGVQSENFSGNYQNVDFFKKVSALKKE